ncbi:MAG: Rha family transcriptional regulator [Selenomonadaceae bacterium]|nr:Rha family transcriptional regulator [Selenomonadaceae bacterium]
MNDLVSINNKQVVTTSRNVAEHFEKNHRDVLKAIRDLMEGMRKTSQTPEMMFFEASYKNEQNGQTYPEYLMNRDGFSLLVMGFNGAKALAWKLKYIEAFNAMEKKLTEPKALPDDAQKKLEIQEMRAKAMLINANTRMAKVAAELAENATIESYKNALIATATNTLAGEKVVELPKSESGRKRHELGWYCEKVGRKRTWASQMSKELAKKGITKEDGKTGEFVETIDNGGHQRQSFEWFEDFLLPIVMINFKPEEKA